jgi:hypothetical protein
MKREKTLFTSTSVISRRIGFCGLCSGGLLDQGNQIMFGYHTHDNSAIDDEHCMVLLEDGNNRFNIHIRGNGGKTRLGEVPDIEGLHPVQTLLLNCFHDDRFGNTAHGHSMIDDRELGDVIFFKNIKSAGDRIFGVD